MGNGMRKLRACFAGDAGDISRRRNDDAVCFPEPIDEGLGHSYCYIPHEFLPKSQYLDESPSAAAATSKPTSFRTISGAAISANVSTPLSTDTFSSTTLDKASAFKSSTLFSSIPLQPVPRNSSSTHIAKSGPILRNSDLRSGPIEQGFLSGPIERNFISGPLDNNNNQFDQLHRYGPNPKKRSLLKHLFTPIPLQPVPGNCDPIHTMSSGPIFRSSGSGSDSTNRGFLSGPIERSFISGPLDNNNITQFDKLHTYGPNSKKRAMVKNLKKVVSRSFWSFYKELNGNNNNSDTVHNNIAVSGSNSGNSSTTITSHTHNLSSENEMSLVYDNDDVENESFNTSPNLQWAQGKAGEDRVHIVISEEQGWVFVGIYDGFNGPDATEFLLNNLYTNVHRELKGLLWFDKSCENSSHLDSVDEVNPTVVNHLEVLKRLSEALRKTEESYLEVADMILFENPELALMGSCVLVMVMKGDDVYLMNVGDSRAVLAQKIDNRLPFGKMRKGSLESYNGYYDYDNELSNSSCQLTLDHCTSTKEEVRRIRNEHKDDAFAVTNDRVKGSLKVTRAFGAGFLKQPKWNNALLEMFRIDYIGTSPYITCLPSVCHHTLESKDKFLILSSDGLYQYFTNEEAVYEVEIFMSTFPEGDPAQHLVKELLFRAAKKAGMDFHQLLDIPQGDRRRYHDDVSIIIISFEGGMWRSSM